MVMAKLHIICGNCGCSDQFKYDHNNEFFDAMETVKQYKTTITCLNCSTIHQLDDNARNKNHMNTNK